MEIGQSAPLNVEEEAKTGAEAAPTLLQQTVALIVKDQALKLRNATPMDVLSTVGGLTMEIGQSALLNAMEEVKAGGEAVLTLHQPMVEPIV